MITLAEIISIYMIYSSSSFINLSTHIYTVITMHFVYSTFNYTPQQGFRTNKQKTHTLTQNLPTAEEQINT
jgi:hypothetical protein